MLFVIHADGKLEPVTGTAEPLPHAGETVVLLGATGRG